MAQDPHDVGFYYLEGQKIPRSCMTILEPDMDSIRFKIEHWSQLKWALNAPVITLKSFVRSRLSGGTFQICDMPVKLVMSNGDDGVLKRGLSMALYTVRTLWHVYYFLINCPINYNTFSYACYRWPAAPLIGRITAIIFHCKTGAYPASCYLHQLFT